jgi:hypothetical protein
MYPVASVLASRRFPCRRALLLLRRFALKIAALRAALAEAMRR